MHAPLSDDGKGDRSLGDTLEIVANLVYLARMSETGSEKQKRILDVAVELLSAKPRSG
jgi:hypothetical protein